MDISRQRFSIIHTGRQRTVHNVALRTEYARDFQLHALVLLLWRELIGVRAVLIAIRHNARARRTFVDDAVRIPVELLRALAHKVGIVERLIHMRLIRFVVLVEISRFFIPGAAECVVGKLARRDVSELRKHKIGDFIIRIEH